MKSHQVKLNDFMEDLNQVIEITFSFNYLLFIPYCIYIQFIASKFKFSLESFGEIKDIEYWLNNSLILSNAECLSLIEMNKSTKGNLLYRASRDGFTRQAFHAKCDGKGTNYFEL